MSGLEEIWNQSCENQNIPQELAKTWLNNVKTKYSTESHRIYHNLNVLNKKCDLLRAFGQSVQYSDYLAFAIVFQYYNFDLKTDCSGTNCAAFREFYNAANIDNIKLLDSVCYLLGDSSKTFSGNAEDILLYQDLDLIVLGSSSSEYKEYQQATQSEYSHLDETTYKKTRLRILETFLQIPQIYSVSCIGERFEVSARANIKQEIAELKN
ncbi:uncharacterized protein LOC116339297 [Contarinia nasturtii]|uniref:uncharacterized protein LOC116339297 n=1 Tax=Contarinia nasturtii TaxID=265458 RepID=UPI0012D42AEF|nr:uncharacterized protein LOC116339297 [Contarinia nasturtii]XP_031620953.1 uncharacterized protein LOC116339297 [Contarinia nasturtii]